jgi:lipopolysaccharide transport system ATP-binding protein
VLLDSGEQLASGTPKLIVGQYQKLLYAPADTRESIRAQIRQLGTTAEPASSDQTEQPDRLQMPLPSAPEQVESFDPNLVPTSTIEYESHGAMISDPSLFTVKGQRINLLVRGRRYVFRYRVTFSEPARFVRFGMSVKTTSGLILAGAISANSLKDSISRVEKGSNFDVSFSFACNLNPRMYFFNAGVFGEIDSEEKILHRITDVLAFRVQHVESLVETEAAFFDINFCASN